MKNNHLFVLLLGAASLAAAMVRVEAPGNAEQATHQPAKLKLPGPPEQDLMIGKWEIQVAYPPTFQMPKGAAAHGTEIWRPGPGGNSLIEEYRESGDMGSYEAIGPSWWDEKEKGRRFLWCDSANSAGCELSKGAMHWEKGGKLFYNEEREKDGKKFERREIFFSITPSSFEQVIEEGPVGGPYQPQVTIHAVRISAELKELALQKATAERLRANKEGDTAAIERLIAPEYSQMDISGRVQDRDTWLAQYFRPLAKLIHGGKFHWDAFEESDMKGQTLGDTAIQTGTLTLKGIGAKPVRGTWEEAPEATIQIAIRFSRTWIWRDGAWQLLLLHNAAQLGTTAK